MLSEKRLIEQGAIFFRYRGQLPVLLILLAVILMLYYPTTIQWADELQLIIYILAAIFISNGHIIRATAVGNRFKHSSGKNRSHHYAENLNVLGWYSVTRNPLYFANFLIWIGLSLVTLHSGVIVLTCIFFWLIYRPIILSEESYLTEKFKSKYSEWVKSTPVFFPSWKNFQKNPLPLSFKTILKNEYPGICATLSCLFILILTKEIRGSNGYFYCTWHLVFLIFIFFFAGTMKFLKHKTHYFKSED